MFVEQTAGKLVITRQQSFLFFGQKMASCTVFDVRTAEGELNGQRCFFVFEEYLQLSFEQLGDDDPSVSVSLCKDRFRHCDQTSQQDDEVIFRTIVD